MNKFLSTLFFISISQLSIAQQDHNWILGLDNNGNTEVVEGFVIDFNEERTLYDSLIGVPFDNQNASVSDKEGSLLLYTNGCFVINANHDVMPNGDLINRTAFVDLFFLNCEIGLSGCQDIMILSDPNDQSDGYYIIHKPVIYEPGSPLRKEMSYCYVDMSLEGGLGAVTDCNVVFHDDLDVAAWYLTAIKHLNKEDWWIVQPTKNDSLIHTFLLDENGVSLAQSQNSSVYIDSFRGDAGGTAKFSPDGTKYALYNFYNQLHLYDFDRETGTLSNHQKIEVFPEDEISTDDVRFCSLEWSPNSRFIYTASTLELHQVDLWETDIQTDGIELIDIYNGTLDPVQTIFTLMSLGPDCKIYMCPQSSTDSYHIIHAPDQKGVDCNFVQNGLRLPARTGTASFPNFPRFRVDEEEKCDPTISSIFDEYVYSVSALHVFPNPAISEVTVTLPEMAKAHHLVVTDLSGKIVFSENDIIDQGLLEVDVTYLQSGVYTIDLFPSQNSERIVYTAQFVKE